MATTTKTEPTETPPVLTEATALDDLPDTVATPPAALAPLPGPTTQELRDDLRSLARVVDAAMDKLPALCDQLMATLPAALMERLATLMGQGPHTGGDLSPADAGALQHLCDALETFGARGMMVTKPYTAALQVVTPQGFPATLTIERVSGQDFFAALAGMEHWLVGNGYKAQS